MCCDFRDFHDCRDFCDFRDFRDRSRPMPRPLENRIAFVTGAASGIGLQIAEDFAREGARVCVADLNEPAARAAANAIRGAGGEAIGVRCDVTREPELDAALGQAVAAWGLSDSLGNNAGLPFLSPLDAFPAAN